MTEEEVQREVDKLIKVIQPVADRYNRDELARLVREKAREKNV